MDAFTNNKNVFLESTSKEGERWDGRGLKV